MMKTFLLVILLFSLTHLYAKDEVMNTLLKIKLPLSKNELLQKLSLKDGEKFKIDKSLCTLSMNLVKNSVDQFSVECSPKLLYHDLFKSDELWNLLPSKDKGDVIFFELQIGNGEKGMILAVDDQQKIVSLHRTAPWKDSGKKETFDVLFNKERK